MLIKETSSGTMCTNCRDFSCDLHPVSSPRVSLQANVLLLAALAQLVPHLVLIRLWGVKYGPAVPELYSSGFNLPPPWDVAAWAFLFQTFGGWVGWVLSSTKGSHICLEECVCVCILYVFVIVKSLHHADRNLLLWLLKEFFTVQMLWYGDVQNYLEE